MRGTSDRSKERGFSYLALLIAVAIIGAMSAGAVSIGANLERRAAEEELLFIGTQFQAAFQSYRSATAPGQSPFPHDLEELVRDMRGSSVRRHIRKIYFDPLTGRRDWGIIDAPGGRISAVHSMAEGHPIKEANFPPGLESLMAQSNYSGWVFGNGAYQNAASSGGSPTRAR